jgi:hypothetical protein
MWTQVPNAPPRTSDMRRESLPHSSNVCDFAAGSPQKSRIQINVRVAEYNPTMMIISRVDGVLIHSTSEEHQNKNKEPEHNHLEHQPETNSPSFSRPVPSQNNNRDFIKSQNLYTVFIITTSVFSSLPFSILESLLQLVIPLDKSLFDL